MLMPATVMVHSAIVTVRRLAIMPAEASLASSFIEGDEIAGSDQHAWTVH
jgi:hypothetical protein